MQAIQLLIGGGEERPVVKAGSFDSFRETSIAEQGLLLPTQAGEVLGVSQQCVVDLIQRRKLTPFTFFEKTFVSAREIAERKQAVRQKGGRPRKELQAAA